MGQFSFNFFLLLDSLRVHIPAKVGIWNWLPESVFCLPIFVLMSLTLWHIWCCLLVILHSFWNFHMIIWVKVQFLFLWNWLWWCGKVKRDWIKTEKGLASHLRCHWQALDLHGTEVPHRQKGVSLFSITSHGRL